MVTELQAVFWDNDGVLVDTEHLFYEACRQTLARYHVELSLEQFIDISLTQGRSCFELLSESASKTDMVANAKHERDVVYRSLLCTGVPFIDDVPDTLKRLHGRVPMAIVTSCQPDHFSMIHVNNGIDDFFDFVLAAGDYQEHKPHPEPYLLAAERVAVEPQNCLVIEDSARGVRAARAAGMRCIAVPNKLTSGNHFGDADLVLPNVRSVLDYLTLTHPNEIVFDPSRSQMSRE